MTTTTAPAPAPAFPLALYASNYGGWGGFTVIFEPGPDADGRAAHWIETHGHLSIVGIEDGPRETDWAGWDEAFAIMFPTCEHGLAARLCVGPGHYPMDL